MLKEYRNSSIENMPATSSKKRYVLRKSLRELTNDIHVTIKDVDPKPDWVVKKYDEDEEKSEEQSLSHERSESYTVTERDETFAKPLVKSFRFQECRETGHVHAQLNIVDNWKDMKDLWWSSEEMQAAKQEAVTTAQNFRERRPDYIECILTVAKDKESQAVENSMKLLMKDSHVRGLESQLACFLSDRRTAVVKAVLGEQRKFNGNFEKLSHSLRAKSLAYSHLSTRFAEKMGQCDQLHALKASQPKKWWRLSGRRA